MRILVTGGFGTVGTGFIKELRARGITSSLATFITSRTKLDLAYGLTLKNHFMLAVTLVNFANGAVFERLGPFDYVFHCAAKFGRWNGEDFYETLWRTMRWVPRTLFDLQERLKFRLIIFLHLRSMATGRSSWLSQSWTNMRSSR